MASSFASSVSTPPGVRSSRPEPTEGEVFLTFLFGGRACRGPVFGQPGLKVIGISIFWGVPVLFVLCPNQRAPSQPDMGALTRFP
jgi:hypothetical protein